MISLSIFVSFMIVLFSVKLLFKRRWLRKVPPGPFSYPIIGNLYQLKQPLHRTFHGIAQTHGPVFSLWFGSRFVVVVSSLQAAQECFTKNDIVLANRPIFLAGKYTSYNNTSMAATSYGDHWRNLRRIMTLEVLSNQRINSFLEIRRDEIMRLVQKLAQDTRNGFPKVELTSRFSEMTFNIIMRIISGKRYHGEDCDVSDIEKARQFRDIIKELVALGGVSNIGDFLPMLRWFDFDDMEKRLKSISKRTDAYLQGIIDEHRNGKNNSNTMINHLLAQQQSQPEYYTDDQIIKGIAQTMLIAGTETSAITLDWAMSNLLNNPEILKKAKNELDTHIGKKRLVDESDLPKLPYIQGIVYETLRLHPAAPMLVPHLSSEDCTIEGYNVPQNTIVLTNAWAINRDPELWNDPTHFKPERFENESEPIKLLLTFGLGRRACPGTNLALRTITLALALLIQCFEWKRISKEEIDMTEEKGAAVARKFPLEAICRVCQSPATMDIF